MGNSEIEGCLSKDISARFHSCDPRLECPGLAGSRRVYINPVIARHKNVDIEEAGLGTGDRMLQFRLGGHPCVDGIQLMFTMNSQSIYEASQLFSSF